MGILDISENHQSMTLWVTGLSCHHSLLTPHQCTYGASIRQLWSWKNTEPELKLNFIKCFTLIAGHREEGTCIKSYCSYLEVIHGLYANDRNLSRVVLNWYLTTWHCLFLPSCWTWNLLIIAELLCLDAEIISSALPKYWECCDTLWRFAFITSASQWHRTTGLHWYSREGATGYINKVLAKEEENLPIPSKIMVSFTYYFFLWGVLKKSCPKTYEHYRNLFLWYADKASKLNNTDFTGVLYCLITLNVTQCLMHIDMLLNN